MRTSRKSGGSLWPRGCETIEDVPNDFLMALDHANRVLDWQENLMKDEFPPVWMWPFDEEIDEWFDEVEAARESRRAGSGGDLDGPGMMVNELAKGKR